MLCQAVLMRRIFFHLEYVRIIKSVCFFSLKGSTSTLISGNSITDISSQENFATLFNEDVLHKTMRDGSQKKKKVTLWKSK